MECINNARYHHNLTIKFYRYNDLSLLKEKGLITEEIFSDAEELLIKSEMDIPSK